MQHKVDVILLTYKPGKQVMRLIEALEKQTYPVHKIIIMNTEEKYFDQLAYENRFVDRVSAATYEAMKSTLQTIESRVNKK